MPGGTKKISMVGDLTFGVLPKGYLRELVTSGRVGRVYVTTIRPWGSGLDRGVDSGLEVSA